jgi:hypothetical protein
MEPAPYGEEYTETFEGYEGYEGYEDATADEATAEPQLP